MRYLLALVLLVCSGVLSAGNSESELAESLYTVRALVSAGVSFNEFSTKMTDVIVAADKYKRAGGANSYLLEAVDNYNKSKGLWAENLRNAPAVAAATGDSRRIRQQLADMEKQMMQEDWAKAEAALAEYEKK